MVVVCPTLLATQLTTMSLDIIVHNILPWCTAITGYQASNNNSNSQQQSTRGYKQASKCYHAQFHQQE